MENIPGLGIGLIFTTENTEMEQPLENGGSKSQNLPKYLQYFVSKRLKEDRSPLIAYPERFIGTREFN